MLTLNANKKLWLSGSVQAIDGKILSYNEMLKEFEHGRPVHITDDRGTRTVYSPIPGWVKLSAIIGSVWLIHAIDQALRVAGY